MDYLTRVGGRFGVCLAVLFALLTVGRQAEAQEVGVEVEEVELEERAGGLEVQAVEYSPVDEATVRVMVLGDVDVAKVTHEGATYNFAAPITGHGSGVIVGRNGLVVTAAHVVADARAVAVHVPGVVGPLPAKVLDVDELRDVAFLQIPGTYTPAAMASPDSSLKVRSTAFALGYPLDATRIDPQSSRGIVSGRLPDGRIQLDAAVNPGNSGGPVIDEDEAVQGIVVARADIAQGAIGIAAAVPLQSFRSSLESFQAKLRMWPSAPPRLRLLADMVSLMSRQGIQIMKGSIAEQSEHSERAQRQIENLANRDEASADAALLAGAFLWNRYVSSVAQGEPDKQLRNKSIEYLNRAVNSDRSLMKSSPFIEHVIETKFAVRENARARNNPRFAGGGERVGSATGAVEFLAAEGQELTLYVERGKSYGTAVGGGAVVAYGATSYERLCTAPCTAMLEPGAHQLAISQNGGTPIPISALTRVDEGSSISGRYQSMAGARAIGWVVLGAGNAIGAAVMLSGAGNLGDDTTLWTGLGVMLGSSLVSIPFIFARDQAKLEVGGDVGGYAASRPGHGSAVERVGWRRGVKLRLTF